jgi:cytoskeletal protein RodZ
MNERSIGESLKQAREGRGQTLSDISQATRINISFLEALERGDFSILPQPYIRLHLKAYAEQVGLDPKELLHQYETTASGSAPPPSLSPKYQPIATEIRFPWRQIGIVGAGIGVIVIAIVVVTVLYRLFSQPSPKRETAIPPPSSGPDTLQVSLTHRQPDTLALPPSSQTPASGPEDSLRPPLISDTLQISLAGRQSDTLAPPPSSQTPASEWATSGISPQQTTGDTVFPGDILVEVKTKKKVWMEVYTAKDTLFYDLLEADERRTWRDRNGIELKVSNWSDVTLTVSGKPVEGIEPTAQIVKLAITKAGTERLKLGRGMWKLHKEASRPPASGEEGQ